MAKGEDSHSEVANVRRSDGINVIFDQTSPGSSRSRSRSRSSGGSSRSSGSRRHKGRSSHRGRYRSSKSSSRSSSRTRSRSHPRCHRPSSRCRCDNHRRYGRSRRSPPRRYRAQSRSYSRSPVRRSHHRRSRSSSLSRCRRAVSRISQSPPRSGSSGHSVNSSLDDKREVLEANATTIQGEEKLELPERLNPVLSEQLVESKQVWPESKQVSPQTWVRQDPQETPSQSSEVDPDNMSSQTTRKTISFSINTSLVKPAVAAPSSAKVTSRVDSYESRKPYGHWVPVKTSKARKRTVATSH